MIEVIEYTPGMTIEPPMFVSGMPNEVYHSHPEGVSASGLKLVERSPAHYRYQAARAPSRAMEIGTAIHAALLEPERFAADYVLLRDVKDRRASEYKAATKVHGSERVLVSTEADQVAGMQEAVLSNASMAKRLNAEGWRELSLFVRDPETGVLIRVRYDLLCRSDYTAVDLKSCQDARPEEFSKSIFNYGYDLQAALYRDAFQWATGESPAFEFAVVEKDMPHGHKLYEPDHTMIQEGRRRYREALNLFAECEQSGNWPGLPCDGPEMISLPSWRMAQIENEIEQEIV